MAVLSLSNLKKTWYYLQKNGVRSAYLAALERLYESRQTPYAYEPVPEKELQRQRCAQESSVRFSVVVPAFETKAEHLRALLDCLEAQTYPAWELILVDASAHGSVREETKKWAEAHHRAAEQAEAHHRATEQAEGERLTEWKGPEAAEGRKKPEENRKAAGENAAPEAAPKGWQNGVIRYFALEKNGGIAENTNAGIALAAGDYIGLLDHDDLLTPDALYEMAKAIEEGKKAGIQPQVLYSDEDKCDGRAEAFYEPHQKMDFNGDLLLSNNYICHFLVMESGLMKRLKLRSSFDGAQDYDLVLRAAGCKARFAHVPKVLYHWRCHSDSTAVNPRSKAYAYEAGKRAVEDFCRQAGWKVNVSHLKHLGFYRADYEEDIFLQRPEVGAVAWPLPDRRRLRSGIYGPDGRMLFEGLKKGFSGPMHRAALQQDVYSADLRAMRVRRELLPSYEMAEKRIAGAGEEKIRQESIRFCEELKKAGYLILWDPQGAECDRKR